MTYGGFPLCFLSGRIMKKEWGKGGGMVKNRELLQWWRAEGNVIWDRNEAKQIKELGICIWVFHFIFANGVPDWNNIITEDGIERAWCLPPSLSAFLCFSFKLLLKNDTFQFLLPPHYVYCFITLSSCLN